MTTTTLTTTTLLLLALALPAAAQERHAVQPCTGGPGDCVWITDGKDGRDGRDGADGRDGRPGINGRDGRDVPTWPTTLGAYDFPTGPLTIVATVPRQDGRHDKLLYRPGVAALITHTAAGQRCYQLARAFHPSMTFTAVTVDAERTFSWHDGSGYWAEPWDVTLPCTAF